MVVADQAVGMARYDYTVVLADDVVDVLTNDETVTVPTPDADVEMRTLGCDGVDGPIDSNPGSYPRATERESKHWEAYDLTVVYEDDVGPDAKNEVDSWADVDVFVMADSIVRDPDQHPSVDDDTECQVTERSVIERDLEIDSTGDTNQFVAVYQETVDTVYKCACGERFETEQDAIEHVTEPDWVAVYRDEDHIEVVGYEDVPGKRYVDLETRTVCGNKLSFEKPGEWEPTTVMHKDEWDHVRVWYSS